MQIQLNIDSDLFLDDWDEEHHEPAIATVIDAMEQIDGIANGDVDCLRRMKYYLKHTIPGFLGDRDTDTCHEVSIEKRKSHCRDINTIVAHIREA